MLLVPKPSAFDDGKIVVNGEISGGDMEFSKADNRKLRELAGDVHEAEDG